MSTEECNQTPQNWKAFCAARLSYMKALAETVEQGFIRQDTSHAVFCGCVDWHSSVHGAYALLAASRLTGWSKGVEMVDEALQPDRLIVELDSLRRGDLDHELPYGYAWFLKLAIEREAGWRKPDLQCLAVELATRLKEWILSLSEEKVIHHVRRREYGNLSWALLNLWEWGNWKQDQHLLDQLSHFTRSRLLPLSQECPPALDDETNEFFPAVLHRYRALLTILPFEEVSTGLSWRQYCREERSPLTVFPTIHSAGLNFSRSWGYWTLFQQTKESTCRDLYIRHIMTHMAMPQYWRDDYRNYAHWVPQFGIYAIALSIEDGGTSMTG